MVLTVFGINHQFIALEKLEQISFNAEDITQSLPLLTREKGITVR